MPQSGVAASQGDGSHDNERTAAPEVGPSRVARSESPDRDRSTAGRDRFESPDRDRSEWPDRDRSEWPDRDRSTGGLPGRRTVTIRGHGTERYVPPRPASSRRRPEHRYERPGFRPDRTAMWAVLLGLMLILAAAASAHAATLHALSHLH